MSDNYILVNGIATKTDILTWGRWMQNAPDRVVKRDEFRNGITVSTVFLGLDHSFGVGEPVLWETMVFGSKTMDHYCERYTSVEAAQRGHQAVIDRLMREEP